MVQWQEIFQSINKNRTRSILSGFTVAFAILLFTVLFGISNGLRNTFNENFGNRKIPNIINIYSSTTSKPYRGFQAGRRIQFRNEDLTFIKNSFEDKIEFISTSVNKNTRTIFKNRKGDYSLKAILPEFRYVQNIIIKDGRFINQMDIQDKTKVAVIGKLVENDLFPNTSALGKYLNLNDIQYKVVGIYRDGNENGAEQIIYTPLTTIQRLYENNKFIDQIALTYSSKMSYDEALSFCDLLEKELKKRFYVSPSDRRAISIGNFIDDYKKFNQMSLALIVLILVIGFGTLIAGIVGISNMMVFIVKERTKEIGIRKAVGAKPKSIVSLILVESILITTISGYLGLIVGVGLLELITPVLEAYSIINPSISRSLVFGATITLVLTGCIAGYIPAKKASSIKPIMALKN